MRAGFAVATAMNVMKLLVVQCSEPRQPSMLASVG